MNKYIDAELMLTKIKELQEKQPRWGLGKIAQIIGISESAARQILKTGRTSSTPFYGKDTADLTEFQILNIANLLQSSNLTYQQIAEDVGCSYGQVAKINTGRSWRAITGLEPNKKLRP